jgi:formylglycine-generating enzyme required for sulfatase activity
LSAVITEIRCAPSAGCRSASALRVLFWLCVAAIAAMPTLAFAQQNPPRFALLIGNSSYPDAGAPLPTTSTDARTLAEEFRRLNFNVDLKENVGKDDMQRAIDAFTGKITKDSEVLFYFSGFGLQVDRRTYLVPVNAQIWSEADARRDGISIDAMLAEMHRRGAKVKVVIIDAARRNPFERRFRASPAGLAPLDAPDGTLALFSAAPGVVIRDSDTANTNSVLVTELVKELRTPNQTAEQAFNHTRIGVSRATNNEIVPWVASSLLDDFYFLPRAAQAAVTPAPPPPAPVQPTVVVPPPPAPYQPPAQSSPPAPEPPPAQTTPEPSPAPATLQLEPGKPFRDCSTCPEMVVVAAGAFAMGGQADYEHPSHRVTIKNKFAIGRYEVTFDEWDKCADEGACKTRPSDRGWGRGTRPVINVSWLDAKAFVSWLSQKTGQKYRLPTEAEWEYAARSGTTTPYWWGQDIGSRQANCRNCNTGDALKTQTVGTFKANSFGLFDTSGNVAEWVEDCWHADYQGAPSDGAAWVDPGTCQLRVLRGGAFDSDAAYVGSGSRFRYDYDVPYSANGFRVVRELPR